MADKVFADFRIKPKTERERKIARIVKEFQGTYNFKTNCFGLALFAFSDLKKPEWVKDYRDLKARYRKMRKKDLEAKEINEPKFGDLAVFIDYRKVEHVGIYLGTRDNNRYFFSKRGGMNRYEIDTGEELKKYGEPKFYRLE
ncbi:MAG: NlpC/P60 family protein [archaeon]